MADTKSDQEKRRDKALKRALSTPPRQHKEDVGKKQKPKTTKRKLA